MERKILFKAKRLDNSEWVEGNLLLDNSKSETEAWINPQNDKFEFIDVDPSTVCQFTGLKDKGDNPIWEHDIVTISKGREPCEVIFENGCFKVVSSKGIHTTIEKGLDYYCWDLRVIDNKFDRKEGEV